MASENPSSTSIVQILSNIPQSQQNLQWFELIFFALTIPVLTINLLRHSRTPSGLLGWLFASNFSAMRAVGYILLKIGGSEGMIVAGTMLTSASTSPLFFATAGIWHEAAHRYKKSHPLLCGWRLQIFIHMAAMGAIALVISGVLTIYYATGPQPSYSQPLMIIGAIGFFLIYVGLCIMFAAIWRMPGKTHLEQRLLNALLLALPLLGTRTVYGICGAALNNSTWSYARGGPLAAQICMQVLPDCLIILIYAIAGFLTRDIVKERKNNHQNTPLLQDMEYNMESRKGRSNVV